MYAADDDDDRKGKERICEWENQSHLYGKQMFKTLQNCSIMWSSLRIDVGKFK